MIEMTWRARRMVVRTSSFALAALLGAGGCAVDQGQPGEQGLAVERDQGFTAESFALEAPADAGAAGWTKLVDEAGKVLLAKVDDDFLYVRIESPSSFTNYNLFINSDGEESGHWRFDWPVSSGADYMVENGILRRTPGPGWGEGFQIIEGLERPEKDGGAFQLKISRAALGLTSWERPIGLGLLDQSPGFGGKLPSTAQFAQLDPGGRTWNAKTCTYGEPAQTPDKATAPEHPICPMDADPYPGRGKPAFQGSRSSFAFGKGMLIPAYIDPGVRPDVWKQLAGASNEFFKLAKAKKATDLTDFVVVANGPDNGPPPLGRALDVKAGYDLVKSANARLFGYVHTCVDCLEEGDKRTGKFIDLAKVKADITQWVCLYPELDGIWLDEFYPRDELGDPVDGKYKFRNGEQNAPSDRCFLQSNNTAQDSVQVDPSDGYFERLTSWIHDTYPQLVIIGNSGGKPESNQKNYHKLVNLLVTLEASYDDARYRKNDGMKATSPEQEWERVTRLTELGTKQAALFHTADESQMTEALGKAKAEHYSHVYVTHRPLNPNVWGDELATYLSKEIELITNKP